MSKIPEGATHQTLNGGYRKFVNGLWLGYCDGYWVRVLGDSICEFKPITKIQAEQEWTGEGLPPEDTTCEVKGCMSHYQQWNKVTVFAVRGKTVFFDMEDGRWGQTDSHEFRTARTPEQIEAESRKDFLARAHKIYMEGAADHRGGIMALYDAGLRFVEVTK